VEWEVNVWGEYVCVFMIDVKLSNFVFWIWWIVGGNVIWEWRLCYDHIVSDKLTLLCFNMCRVVYIGLVWRSRHIDEIGY